ncbi:glycosyltransferase [Streptomyces sp. NPDC048172]|uniref:glycosyltransferase n=1 Tax=Streptomyces sp. NPDC048172 TaxID=3365505 RepID=UPI003719C974
MTPTTPTTPMKATTSRAPAVRRPEPRPHRPHLLYLAIGFPPAAKSCAYRMLETANQFRAQGWDVTVLTIRPEAWERDSGLDHSLSERVDPGVRLIELPLEREDLETDVRAYSEARALDPTGWVRRWHQRQRAHFPEPAFGGWRAALERAVLRAHREHPVDLMLATCVPYVSLAAALRLHEEHAVPYAVDFRDGWSLDVLKGVPAFERDSDEGRWEERALRHARELWVVNDPIADFYRERHPSLADRVRVVRNGYDEDSVPPAPRTPAPGDRLTFGYLGTVNFSLRLLETVLEGWRLAREREPLLRDARFEVRGHLGAGAGRGATAHADLLSRAADDGVSVAGPVAKADVGALYGRWDALVLMLTGGRYVTSGKVYEYMASGLPVVSAHEPDHDAAVVLEGHPLWTGARGVDAEALADAFAQAARLATGVDADAEARVAARAHAARFARLAQIAPAVEGLATSVAPGPQVPLAPQTAQAQQDPQTAQVQQDPQDPQDPQSPQTAQVQRNQQGPLAPHSMRRTRPSGPPQAVVPSTDPDGPSGSSDPSGSSGSSDPSDPSDPDLLEGAPR